MKRLIKNRVFIGIILAVCVAALICCSILLPLAGKKKMSEAYTGTNLGSLTFNDYDTRTDGNVFNGDILKKLFGAMTGSTNEDKTATLKEATDAVNASSSTVTSRANNSTSYPLTQAQSMNYSQLKGKAGYTIAVEFGGFTWNVVYATIAGGDLIVTLWQSEASGSYQWNTYSSLDTNNNYPSNMYSTSYIRAAALNGGAPSGAVSYATSNTVLNGLVTEAQRKSNQYAAFTLDNSTIGQKSLTSYLVKPNQVAYQEQENYVWAFNGNGASVAYLCPNEAWGSPDTTLKHNGSNAASKTGGWYSGGTNQSNMTPVPLKSNYNDWANDTLWLPSWTETGWYDSAASCCQSLWGIPNGDAILSSSGNTWFRSGSYNVAATSHGLAPSGGQWYGTPTTSACVRPALHLNLTKAMENAGESIKKPADVKVTYNGLDQTVSDIPEADRPAWYDANFYGDTDKVSITYVDSKNATVTPKEAGTYTATVELKSTKYRWSDTTTDSASFTGNRTRTFTFTINPIKLTVPKITNSPQTYDPVNGSHFTVDTNFDASTMTGVGVTTGISWNSASTRFDATNAGTYSVKFQLLDTKNYVWDVGTNGTNADQTATVKVDPKKLTVPTITAPQEYTGSALQFVLADFNAGQYIKVNSASAANGNTVTGAGGATIVDTTDTFEAVKVDKYTVSLSLRDTTNYAWSDGTNTAKNVEFEITQKELLSAPPVSSEVNGTGGAEWNFGDGTVTITITDDRATGENINLLCYYDIAGGTSKSNTLTSTTTGNVTTITMPASIAVGKYTLTVELNGNTGDNANYKITKNNTLDFEITSGKIDPSKYDWTYTKDGAAGGTSANDGSLKVPFELKAGSTVDGVKYELSIQIPTADASAVVVDTSKYVNGYQVRSGDKVNTYKTIVALKSIDTDFQFEVNGNMQSTCEVEFNWEIEKGTFDLSNVKWEYTTDNGKSWTEYDSSNPPQYNDGNYVTVRVKATTLPNGLTLDSMYDGDGERTVGNYTATIAASDLVYNTDNFNAPDTSVINLSWEIAKKNLYNGFTNSKEPYSNANYSGTIILKKLKLDDSKFEDYVEYKYYDMKSGLEVTLEQIKADTDPTDEKKYKVEAYIKAEYSANYAVHDNGSTPQDQFKTGSKNVLATATVDGKDGSTPITAEYDGGTHFDPSVIKVVGDDGITVTDYTVVYYKGKTPVAGNELAAGELPKDAGDYCIEIVLGPVAEAGYILGDDWFTVTVEAKGIALPELSEMIFNGNELNFVDYLSGDSWTTYGPSGLDIIKVDGKLSDRNVGAGSYVTTLTITDPNYKWIYPAAKSLGVTGDDITATYNWNITPLVVDTTNMWNKGKTGATLNLPNNIRDFIAGGTLELGYRYYDSEGNFVEEPELKGGKSFKVEAVFSGDDAERNIVFKTGDNEFGAVSNGIDYTVPKNGAAVFFGSIGEFFENYWQPFVSGVCIVLSAIFAGLIGHFDSRRRKANKEAKQYKTGTATNEPKQYKTAAVAATGLFGLAYATWTIIACVLIGLAVALFIGIFIAKARRNKAREALEAAKIEYAENKVVLAEQAKQDEADRLKKEQADEREEEKRRRDEEREEERRRKEEERDEEKRRKEEEREEEKRRREEQREEERRRREEEREDERRRREDERRIAAMSNNNMGMGMNPAMGYGAMSPFAMQYAQPPVVQQQPQPMQVVQPAQQVVASTDESKLEKAVEKLATELGHQKRVEGFLDMISKSREKDQAALAQSEKALEERKKKFEARRENMSAPFEPSVQRVYIPAMPANANTREKELELELREKEKALREKEQELEREKNKGEKVVQAPQTVAQQPVVQPAPQPAAMPAPQPVVQPVIQQVPVQVPMQTPVYPQPMYMPQGYMPSPYWQAPMPQGYAQPSYREYELERELERMRVRDYERMRNLEHELGIDRDRNFYVGQIKSNTPAQPYAQPALPQPMPQSYVQPQAIPQSYTQATVRELELERDLREKERERTRELERELALEKERNRFAQEKPTVTAQPNTQPQPVVVVPPIVQTQPSEQQQQEIAQPAPARFLRRNNPFAANRFAEGNDD